MAWPPLTPASAGNADRPGITTPGAAGLACRRASLCGTAMRLGVGQGAYAGRTRDAAALGVTAEVVAGDPQPRIGEQHVVCAVPSGPAVQPLAGGVQDQRSARRAGGQAGQAGSGDRARALRVAAVLVVE